MGKFKINLNILKELFVLLLSEIMSVFFNTPHRLGEPSQWSNHKVTWEWMDSAKQLSTCKTGIKPESKHAAPSLPEMHNSPNMRKLS